MKDFYERLEAIKYPCHDKLLNALYAKSEEIESIILKDIRPEDYDAFSYLDAVNKAYEANPELSKYLNRLRDISFRRNVMISNRANAKKEAIYAEMSSEEREELVIS